MSEGKARTNYVFIEDMKGLIAALSPFNLEICMHHKMKNYACIVTSEEHDGWPSLANDGNDEIEFSFDEMVMPYVRENEILIAMEVASEDSAYLHGLAQAFVRRNGEVLEKNISLYSIHEIAANAFDSDLASISRCQEHVTLPKYLDAIPDGDLGPLKQYVESGEGWRKQADKIWACAADHGALPVFDYLIEVGSNPFDHQAVLERTKNAAAKAWWSAYQMKHDLQIGEDDTAEPVVRRLCRI